MPNPPDPSGRSSSRETRPASGSSVRSIPDRKPEDDRVTLEGVLQSEPDDDSPTIISANRPRHPSPDSHLAESLAGRKLGHFELIESVGVGGMAAVIRANDLQLGRVVALKILPPDLAVDPENITRFKQEARAAAKLDHENIARVYFCGEDQGLHFIAFEFVEGENLRVRAEQRGGILPVADCVRYLIQVAAGLSHAASRGVVHRDIKPSNIIITPEGKAKIVDMGLARNLDAHSMNGGVTQSGMTLGTFDYISPEQAIEPRLADIRSDIYSLGCTFYHLLTGHPPVPEGTAAKKLHAHEHTPPMDPRLLNHAIPDELAAILGRMMAKSPAKRYQHPDHLIQHVLGLAERLHISVGALTHDPHANPAYSQTPLPEPPRLSAAWIVTGILVLLIMAAGLTGGFGLGNRDPLDPPRLWTDKKAPAVFAPSDSPSNGQSTPESPVAAQSPRSAANVAELVELLKQGAPQIHLTGDLYDFTRAAKRGEPDPEALFQGAELTLRGDPGKPPTIKLKANAPDDGKSARPGSLTVRGADDARRAVTVTFRDMRFEFAPPDDPLTASVAISLSNVDRFDSDHCEYVPNRPDGAIEAIAQADVHFIGQSDGVNAPEARFNRCYFAPGGVGVRVTGRASLSATQCALAPRAAMFQILPGLEFASPEAKPVAVVRLDHCSALLDGGAVVEIAERVPCRVLAGNCLLAGADDAGLVDPTSVLVRQLGDRDPATVFEVLKSGNQLLPNGYYAIAIYADDREKAVSFADAKKAGFRADDGAARLLTVSPWAAERPVDALDKGNPQSAFRVNLDQGQLRLPVNSNKDILGARWWLNASLYEGWPPRPVSDVGPSLADNQRVWQPDLAAGPTPAGHFRTLREALANVKEGDELLLRFNGVQEVVPHVFTGADTRLVLKADAGYRPVLGLAKTAQAFLFKLSEGTLLFEGVQFRLRSDRGRTVVALPGGGRCQFRNCVFTIEDGDGPALSAVALSDPAAEMMMMGATPDKLPAPKVAFDRCFVRGKGRLVTVKGSRPFDLDVKDSLAVLDGNCIDIEPTSADLTGAAPANIRLQNVTAYLSGHLVRMQANSKGIEAKGLGLTQTRVRAENSLFAPAIAGTPLVRLDRFENEKQMGDSFVWEEPRNNLYNYSRNQEMLKIQPESADAMPLKMFDADAWLAKWLEPNRSFSSFRFAVQPEAGASFTSVQVRDFELRPSETPLKPEDGSRYGAPLESLPAPVEQ